MFGLNSAKVLAAAATLVLAGWAGTASAATLDASNAGSTTNWSVNFTCPTGYGCDGVSATAGFSAEYNGYSSGTSSWNVTLMLANTTSGDNGFLTAIGFNTSPDATISNVADAGTGSVSTTWDGGTGTISGSYNTELCVWDGQGCTAGDDKTLAYGATDVISFLLSTSGDASLLSNPAFTIDGYAVKFVSVGSDNSSYEFAGYETPPEVLPRPDVQTPSPVPLPATGLLLLGALGGLGVAKRRHRRAA